MDGERFIAGKFPSSLASSSKDEKLEQERERERFQNENPEKGSDQFRVSLWEREREREISKGQCVSFEYRNESKEKG